MAPTDPRLLAQLVEVVGQAHVLTDPDVTAGYCTDWTGRFRGVTPAVVRPGSTPEVAGVVGVCRALGTAMVPQGGNTGLVGGGVPLGGEVVVSLRRLSDVGPCDDRVGHVTAGAGASLAAVQEAAASAGWAYGVDFASRHAATIGGTVATNAGGSRVQRYGDTRAQLVGAEAVLGDGSVVSHLGGLAKDNTGYDLASLLCGSEGTLGIVTAARLRLVARADERVTALLAFDSVEAAVHAGGALARGVRSVEAVELMLEEGLALVCRATGLPRPFPGRHRAYVLVEAADSTSPLDELSGVVGSVAAVAAAAVAVGSRQRAELWRYRDGLPEAINTLGPPHKLDVSVPADRMAEFLCAVPEVAARAATGPTSGAGTHGAVRTWLFGHLGDGNVHVNVTGAAPDDDGVDEAVLRLVAGLGGSVGAEHGIGTAKRAWLSLSRSPAELDAFRALKRALDPSGILNPNVLLPPAVAQ